MKHLLLVLSFIAASHLAAANPTITSLTYDGSNPFVNGTNLQSNQSHTITATANAETTRVVFKVDGVIVLNDNTRPFDYTFTPTAVGAHIFKATPKSVTATGAQLTVNYNVVSATPTPTPTPTPSAKKILHWGSSSNRVTQVATNKTYIDTLPFDGIAVGFPDSQVCLGASYIASYTTLYNQIGPMKNLLTHVVHNYAIALIGNSGMTDPFDSWTQTQNNFVTLAQVCRDAGLDGIFYDNEEYNVHMWQYPSDCKYGSTKTLSQYQEQWRLRGNQVMAAILAQWPTAKIVVTIGPWRSTNVGSCVFQGDNNWLGGYFFAGLFATGTTQVIDAGEKYPLRTTSDFQCLKNFDSVTLTQSPISPPLVPSSLTATWQAQYNQAFGIYDQDTVGTPDMTYSVLQATLINSVPYATEFVWNYDESLDWLNPNGGATANWKNAVWNARSQLGLPAP